MKKEVDEFKDAEGLHFKAGLKLTSKTPGLNPSLSLKTGRRVSVGELRKDASKMSLNFGGLGSRSNISSIVHMEEVSAG